MEQISLLEHVGSGYIQQYLSNRDVAISSTKKQQILIAASLLVQEGQIPDTGVFRTHFFITMYMKHNKDLHKMIRSLFPDFELKQLTRLQAICLLCMKAQAEPFTSYLVKSLSNEVLDQLCNAEVNVSEPRQTAILQSLLAEASPRRRVLKPQIQEFPLPPGIYMSFYPVQFQKSVWEQIQDIIGFCVKLQTFYSFLPCVKSVTFKEDFTSGVEFFVQGFQSDFQSVLDYLQRHPKASNRIHKKLRQLLTILVKNKLFLKHYSLSTLTIDEYENVWIIQLNGSYEAKQGRIMAITYASVMEVWNNELAYAGLSTMQSSASDDIDDDEEDTYEIEEDEEIGINID